MGSENKQAFGKGALSLHFKEKTFTPQQVDKIANYNTVYMDKDDRNLVFQSEPMNDEQIAQAGAIYKNARGGPVVADISKLRPDPSLKQPDPSDVALQTAVAGLDTAMEMIRNAPDRTHNAVASHPSPPRPHHP